jgi:hypothetical protein
MMGEEGLLKGDDVRLTVLRNRLWRAARVILDVSLHTGRMTLEQAVDFLVDKVRFERYAAELLKRTPWRRKRRAAHRPGHSPRLTVCWFT